MNNNTNSTPSIFNQDKVLEWAKTLWSSRKIFIKSIAIVGAIGLLIALLTPKEYISWTTMVPQTSNPANKLGGISSLAAMAGFNLDMGLGEGLSPAVYPQIVGSVPFQLELMNTPLNIGDANQPTSLYSYYSDISNFGLLNMVGEYTIGLPGKLIEAIRGNNKKQITEPGKPIHLTQEQEEIRKIIENKVTLDVDVKFGFLTLHSSFPDAELAAQVADGSCELLQKYITQHKIKKATDRLSFIDERYQEKKNEFLKIQENLARFRDQNKNVSSALAATEEERLRSEYTIALSVYNELAKQLEQAKIQIKEDTPVFSIIQPATVPLKQAKPNKLLIITIWLFLGAIIGIGIIFGKEYIVEMKKKWNETN